MKNMTKEGKSIILITHKLREIKEAANRCTVIRRGKYIGTVDVKDATEEKYHLKLKKLKQNQRM